MFLIVSLIVDLVGVLIFFVEDVDGSGGDCSTRENSKPLPGVLFKRGMREPGILLFIERQAI